MKPCNIEIYNVRSPIFFFQAEDGIRDYKVTGVQTCALPIWFGFVEEVPGHRVARHRDVALGEHDLEEMRVPVGRAKHLGAAVQVHAPDAPEALVEALRVQRAHALPVAVEALAPGIQRERVVAPQVLDVEDLKAALLHLDDDVDEAQDPAPRENVLADEEIGVHAPDMADEMQQPDAALLEVARMRLDQLGELVAPGVLQAADGGDLVELAPGVAEVGVHLQRRAEAPALDLAARVLRLRAGGVDGGHAHPVVLVRVEHEAAEAAAHVDHLFARLEEQLARHVLGLVALRLLQRARAFLPVRAGIEHERVVEPQLVELGPERVMELRVLLRLPAARVVVQELVPAVEQAHRQLGAVDAALHAGGERLLQAAVDVDLAVEIGLQHADVPEHRRPPLGARGVENQGEGRRGVGVAVLPAAREAHAKGGVGRLPDPVQQGFKSAWHLKILPFRWRRGSSVPISGRTRPVPASALPGPPAPARPAILPPGGHGSGAPAWGPRRAGAAAR